MGSAWKTSSQYSRSTSRHDTGDLDDWSTNTTHTTTRNIHRGVGGIRHRFFALALAGITLASLALIGIAEAPVASAAATAPAAAQCDTPAFPTGAGQEVTCDIAITNSMTAANATTSTITATACLAAAGVLPPAGCVTTVTTSNQLVTTVDQCNAIVNGGGSNVTCNVTVTNDIPIGTTPVNATVNQCIGSGTGGGGTSTVTCAPTASTTNATVTQCNGSATGGGAARAGGLYGRRRNQRPPCDHQSVQRLLERRWKHSHLHNNVPQQLHSRGSDRWNGELRVWWGWNNCGEWGDPGRLRVNGPDRLGRGCGRVDWDWYWHRDRIGDNRRHSDRRTSDRVRRSIPLTR